MGINAGAKILLVFTASFHCAMGWARYKKFDGIEFSNDLSFEEITTPAKFSKAMDIIFEKNDLPQFERMSLVPFDIIDRSRRMLMLKGYDPYFLKNYQLKIPLKSLKNAHTYEVIFNSGKLFGMSNFRSIEESNSIKDPLGLWLAWNNLHATYAVTVDKDGLKNIGDVDIRAERLIMHVQLPSINSKQPKMEISKVIHTKTYINGLDMVSENIKNAIIFEIEDNMIKILNSKIRNILLNFVRQSIEGSPADNELSQLMMSSQFYEIHF